MLGHLLRTASGVIFTERRRTNPTEVIPAAEGDAAPWKEGAFFCRAQPGGVLCFDRLSNPRIQKDGLLNPG
jgi:hypothetical protein